jgi:glycyl-tRNA synthetase
MVEDVVTGERYRADHLLEEHGVENGESLSLNEIDQIISQRGILSPSGNLLSQSREYNMMFETYAGAVQDETGKTYLRPETAQGMFVNFRNVVDSLYPDLPFGLAQTGRCFRNEISPREFLFRVREFEIMELEYFIEQHDWQKVFEDWRQEFYRWCEAAGLDTEKVHELDVPQEKRAHYSDKTIDFEYEFSFGTKEIAAVAYRTDFDLGNHTEESGVSLQYPKKDRQERITPHVIEPTWGLDRNLLAVLSEAYREEDVEGETRVVLGLPFRLAPVKVAVFPLLQNKPELVEKARQVYQQLKKEFPEVMWDGSGNVGKRYRRQDEIGTPYCVTVDFDSLEDEAVTVRDRDTMEQERVSIQSLTSYIASQ